MQLEMRCPHCEVWGVTGEKCSECGALMDDYDDVPERPLTLTPDDINADIRTVSEISISNFTVTIVDTDVGFAAAVTSFQGEEMISAFAAMMSGNKEITTEDAPIVEDEHPYAAAGQAVDAFMLDE